VGGGAGQLSNRSKNISAQAEATSWAATSRADVQRFEALKAMFAK